MEFLKRHKKKFIALGVIGGLGVGGYYYARRLILDGMRQVEELGRDLQEKMVESQNREREKLRLRAEAEAMLSSFIPPFKKKLRALTDPKDITERLREIRARSGTADSRPGDQEAVDLLWRDLKVISITRLFAAIYGLALLNCMLRVQQFILGRMAFEENLQIRKSHSQGAKDCTLTDESTRERYLFSSSDHFLNSGEGMAILVDFIRETIEEASVNWVMGTDAKITRQNIHENISTFRNAIENRLSGGIVHTSAVASVFVSCLIPDDEVSMFHDSTKGLTQHQNESITEMLNETLDMFESPIFLQAFDESVDKLFDNLDTIVYTYQFSDSANNTDEFALTKVIVGLKHISEQVFEESPQDSAFQQALGDVPMLNQLCDSIFMQGHDEGLGDFGAMDGLGISEEDMKSLAQLLGGNDTELLGLLSQLGGGAGSGNPVIDEAQVSNLLENLTSTLN